MWEERERETGKIKGRMGVGGGRGMGMDESRRVLDAMKQST